ncbi:MAG: hypothetical protein M0Z50_01455 [Planctomycetia bacterium]|nr:hypothetical protein [Planctomycetia bacterium]
MRRFRPSGPLRAAAISGLAGLVLLLVGVRASGGADTRLPIPPKSEQTPAMAKFQRYFTAHYGRLDSDTGQTFAKYLVGHYGQMKSHPVTRYVALSLALRAAIRVHNMTNATPAIDLLAKYYVVDPWKLRLQAAAEIAPYIFDHDNCEYLANTTAHWAKGAAAADDFATAAGLIQLSEKFSRRLGQRYRLASDKMLLVRYLLLSSVQPQAKADQKLIGKKRDDAGALLRLAIYHWLVSDKPGTKATGDAEAKKSGSAALAEILKLAAKNPQDAQQLIRLGNLWWNLSKTHKLLAYAPLVQEQARKIYRRAIPDVAQAFSAMVGRGDYHTAILFLGEAKKAARRTRSPEMLSIAHRWNRMLHQARVLHRQYTAALKAITKKVDDPTANQVIGEYLCFLGGRWKDGLAYLKLAGLPSLRQAANEDLANPQTPAAQIAIGNRWWNLAHGYHGVLKRNIQLRAAYWYALALKKLPVGADKDLRYRVAKLRSAQP